MSLSLRFEKAQLRSLALAKVGNPLREEALQTSRALCHFEAEDAELLTHCFLKSFKSLDLHQLHHHTALESNELFGYAKAIFDDNAALLEKGALIAKHLYAKSHHPNIKSGDLCIGLLNGLAIGGTEDVQAISIIKSESKVPFLQISERDGDLVLSTEHGIYPDKIDKGCLIVNHSGEDGFWVYLFDKSGGNTHFWNRDFVGARPVKSDDYLTKRYSELCVSFAEKGLPEELGQEERVEVAKSAISYLNETEEFDEEEFKAKAFHDAPEMVEKFDEHKAAFEEDSGQTLEPKFTVSKPEAKKAKRRMKSKLKLDVGVELTFSSNFLHDDLIERGEDEEKGMSYLKIYYYREV